MLENMKNNKNEKIRLKVREILLTFCDGINSLEEIFGHKWQRKEAKEYWKWRELDKKNFHNTLYRLEKQGYIERYMKNKKNLIKLTPLGKNKSMKYLIKDTSIQPPDKWDGKWRLVIFDVPEDKKKIRDIIRSFLKRWRFFQLQESVFVHPFNCEKEISAIKYIYRLNPYMQFIVAEHIESENDLLKHFIDNNIINNFK